MRQGASPFSESLVQFRRVPSSTKVNRSRNSAQEILNKVSSPQHNIMMARSFIPGLNKSFGDSPLLTPTNDIASSLGSRKVGESRSRIELNHDFNFEGYHENILENNKTVLIHGEIRIVAEVVIEIVKHRSIVEGNENDDKEEISYICPFSHVPITCPGRSIKCEHSQCFDLREFLSLVTDECWRCPICGIIITFEDLRFDPFFFSARPPKEVGIDSFPVM